jgi:hypothetical protein
MLSRSIQLGSVYFVRVYIFICFFIFHHRIVQYINTFVSVISLFQCCVKDHLIRMYTKKGVVSFLHVLLFSFFTHDTRPDGQFEFLFSKAPPASY